MTACHKLKVFCCRQSRLSILATPTTTPTHQHQLTNTNSPTDWSSGCHFRRVCRGGSGHVFSSALLRISVVPHKFHEDFRPGGRGSGCHFRPAAGTRRGVVQECGFIKDFSCTAQISCRQAVGARDVIFGRPWGSGWDVIFGRPTAWRHGTAQISLGFQLYRTNFIRISVVPHKVH